MTAAWMARRLRAAEVNALLAEADAALSSRLDVLDRRSSLRLCTNGTVGESLSDYVRGAIDARIATR